MGHSGGTQAQNLILFHNNLIMKFIAAKFVLIIALVPLKALVPLLVRRSDVNIALTLAEERLLRYARSPSRWRLTS